MFFKDRYEAGVKLAEIVSKSPLIKGRWDVIGIARGGVVIASEIARRLRVNPKVICVEEVNLNETAILAASSTGSGMVFTKGTNHFLPILTSSPNKAVQDFAEQTHEKQIRLAGSKSVYGNKVIVCDDGVVTARTLVTAIRSLKHYGVKEIVAAIPVVTPRIMERDDFSVIAWRVTKMTNPATGMFYKHFGDVEDAEVMSLLSKIKAA